MSEVGVSVGLTMRCIALAQAASTLRAKGYFNCVVARVRIVCNRRLCENVVTVVTMALN